MTMRFQRAMPLQRAWLLCVWLLFVASFAMCGHAEPAASTSASAKTAPFPTAPFPAVSVLVVHGDSITVGVGASEASKTSWPARLQELIERYQNLPVRVSNLAVSGTDAVTQQESGAEIAAQKPDLVCLLLGINDLRQARPVAQYAAAMEEIIADIKKGAPDATIILGSPTWMQTYQMADPQWAVWSKGNRQLHLAYRAAVRVLAAKDGCLFADTYGALEGNPRLIPDTVHPDDVGCQLIADSFFQAFVLQQTPPATGEVKADAGVAGKLAGKILGGGGAWDNSEAHTYNKAFDGDTTTFANGNQNSNGNGCWVGLDLGEDKTVIGARFFPVAGYKERTNGAKFQGSTAADFSADVVDLASVGVAVNGWNQVAFSQPAKVRYVRYLSPDGGWGSVAEVEFLGY